MKSLIKQSLTIWAMFVISILPQTSPAVQDLVNNTGHSYFIENKGQWDPGVKFLARLGGMNAWITTQGIVYDFYKIDRKYDLASSMQMTKDQKNKYEIEHTTLTGQVVNMELIGVNSNSINVGSNQKEGYYNYFIGNDQNKWAGNVNMYEIIEQQGTYEGIDLRYYFDEGM